MNSQQTENGCTSPQSVGRRNVRELIFVAALKITSHNRLLLTHFITKSCKKIVRQTTKWKFQQYKLYFSKIKRLYYLVHFISQDCPWSYEMRELRSQAYVSMGDSSSAILDLRSANKLQSDNTAGYFRLAMLHYQLGQAQESLRFVLLDLSQRSCYCNIQLQISLILI